MVLLRRGFWGFDPDMRWNLLLAEYLVLILISKQVKWCFVSDGKDKCAVVQFHWIRSGPDLHSAANTTGSGCFSTSKPGLCLR